MRTPEEIIEDECISSDEDVAVLEALLAERDRLRELVAHTLDEYEARMPRQWVAHARAALAREDT